MTAYSRFLDWVERGLSLLVLCFYIAVVVVVCFQVLNRFWLHWPIVWTSDLAVICFIWLGFLTAAKAVRRSGHFRLGILLDFVGEGRTRAVLETFACLVGLLIFALLVIKGYEMADFGRREIAPGLQVSMFWAYLALPLSGAVALTFYVEQLHKELTGTAASERLARKDLLGGDG